MNSKAALLILVVATLAPWTRADDPPDPVAPPASSPHRGPSDPAELEAFIDGVMAAQMRETHIAGATIAVVVDNKPFFAKGYGYADVEARKPVDPAKTMFRIGSVSKLFTWTAVMQLVEQGKLDLDTDINEYLVDFQIPRTYPEPITLRHLLSHTPGFEDHVIGLFGRGPNETSLGELLSRNLPARVRKPGLLASYSNHGTAIAGYIVEEVSGMPWEDYIEQHLLEPLDMHDTTVRQPAEEKLPPEISAGYKYDHGRFVRQKFEYVPPAPAGSVSASAGDIAKFMIAHLQNGEYGSNRILSEASARRMRELLFTHDPRIDGMAYGFMRMTCNGEQIVEHGGDTFAFHSFFMMLPERKSGLFVSYNTTTAGPSRDYLFKAFMDRYYPALDQAPPKLTADFNQRAGRFGGQYGAIRHSYTSLAKLGVLFGVADISVDDDQLVLSVNDGKLVLRFVEVEPNLFREVDGSRQLAFGQEGGDRATQLFLSGSPVAWTRLPWYDTPRFTLALLLACVGVFASVVIGWPLAAFINRGHGAVATRTRGSKVASWLAWLTSLAILIVIALALIPFSNPTDIAYGVPRLLTGLVWSTLGIAALVAAVAVCTFIAWKNHYWRLSARWHYSAVLLAGVAFLWFLSHWNLLSA